MNLYFGLELDDRLYPYPDSLPTGCTCLGPQGLLQRLESHLGLAGHPHNNEHLRIEQYRQALGKLLKQQPQAFFRTSFAADELATAKRLLELRDELLLAGWDFADQDQVPPRLRCLARIEVTLQLAFGYADRFVAVLKALPEGRLPVRTLFLNDPAALLPSHYHRLFAVLRAKGLLIEELPEREHRGNSDLVRFQQLVSGKLAQRKGLELSGDGSLLLFKAKRETEAAGFLARLCRQNPELRPVCFVPEKNRAFDNALIQEGLPSPGILSASLARPSLQILKLITTFLWHPIDPFKILEFVSLALKPLHDELAAVIASEMAQRPGIRGESWQMAIRRFFDNLHQRAEQDTSIDVAEIRKQYNFWFERQRYDASKTVPKHEVIEIFDYLATWAYDIYEESDHKNNSLQVLSGQARRIKDLLETLPENQTQLSQLELERIVRTIYEPAPVEFIPQQLHHLPTVHHPSALIAPCEEVLWWNFVRNERDHFFSTWYRKELAFLEAIGVRLQSPADKNQLQLWQRNRPLLQAQHRLLLIMPAKVDGSEVYPHALHDELLAAFGSLDAITFDINKREGESLMNLFFELPQLQELRLQQLGRPSPFLRIHHPEKLDQREHETFSSLESLFYYPYQYLFRHKTKLRKSSILSIVRDVTLMGNLAHRFFELLCKEDNIQHWNRQQVQEWVDRRAGRLLSREGAVLLMYGREPERVAFINRIKYAAWSLVAMIQENNWQVVDTEKDLQGQFLDIPIRAKADLVLQRADQLAVVDLKWRGGARRERIIRNEEDLQLVMYARLLTDDEQWAHTAYFIIEEGRMIARNNAAFKEVAAVAPDADTLEVNGRIWSQMINTFRWRSQQLQEGIIEVRTESTLHDIEERYSGQMMELLEMKDGNAPFDDYRTLINLVE
ncbi:MAG: PD-(D/E)XK nuclease family protein [Bacteroidota bacterium]